MQEDQVKMRIVAAMILVAVVVSTALAYGAAKSGPNPVSASPASDQGSTSYTYTSIDYPGAARSRANGINDRGDIVGIYLDSSGVWHGYLLSGGTFTTIDAPGSIQTRTTSINNRGVIGGYF